MPDIASTIHAVVDLDKPIVKTILRDLFVTEDKNAHTFRVKITRSGEPVDLTGASVTGYFMRYKDRVSVPVTGSVDGSEAVVTLNPSCYTTRTAFCLTICVAINSAKHAVFAGEGQMVLNRSDMLADPENIIPSIEDIIAQYGLMQEGTSAANTAAASANTAAGRANTAANVAETATANANSATARANAAAQAVETAPVPTGTVVTYQAGDNAQTPPSGEWLADVPAVPQGGFLWTRIVQNFTNGDPVTIYSVARQGVDGMGTVRSVCGIGPNEDGDVPLTPSALGEIDAATLGGKAPGYYLPVRELLDNCAFEIAQAGIDGKHGNYQYVADRWIAETVANAVIVSEKSGDVMTISNTGTAETSILQRTTVEWLDQFVGQTVTLAVCLADGTILCASGAVPAIPESGSAYICTLSPANGVTMRLSRFTTQQQLVRMTIQPGSNISVKWIRLVLGEYTAETLPPYLPRPYAVELAECQRYFVQYESNHAFSHIASGLSNADAGGTYFPVHLPVPMRIAPSIWFNDISKFQIYTKNAAPTNLTIYSVESNAVGHKYLTVRAGTQDLGLTASTSYLLNMTTGAILQFIADP